MLFFSALMSPLLFQKMLHFQAQACTHCLACAEICPTSALSVSQNRLLGVDQKACVLCGACVSECPENALNIS